MTTPYSLWDDWNAGGGPRYPHAKVIQYCFRNFPAAVRSSTRVLDLGCGSGVNTKFLAEQGFDCDATDISPVGVANAQALLSAHGLSARCVVAPADAQPFEASTFDLVVCVGVLDSAGREVARATCAEIGRILRPGGHALLVFASDADMRVGPATPYGLTGFSHEEVSGMVSGLFDARIDRYITTYENGTLQHNDFLVTLKR